MVNELGEARYVRKLRGQSQLWNVVEAFLLGLVCAAFCFRMIAFASGLIQVSERRRDVPAAYTRKGWRRFCSGG